MKNLAIIVFAAWGIIPNAVRADSPATPRPWVATSERGEYLFKMVPAKWRKDDEKYVIGREAFGVAYKVTEDGELDEIWRTEGWYTFEGYLSEDGQYFVRFGPWASDQKKHTDLAIAFYDRGKLLMKYRVRDLIKRPELLTYSTSHYDWKAANQTKPNGFKGGTFHLAMIDKMTYSFDYETGEIIISRKDLGVVRDSKALTNQLSGKDAATAKERMAELLEGGLIKRSFLEQLELTDIYEIPEISYLSGRGDSAVWIANFNSNDGWLYDEEVFLKEEVEVSIAIPIIDSKKLRATVVPTEIHDTIKTAIKHPYVGKLIDEGIEWIRVHIRGDRLYWNPTELEEYLKRLTGRVPDEGELRNWANLVIKIYDIPGFQSIYVNTLTGSLIYEEESKDPWEWEPILQDRSGKQNNANKTLHTKH